MTCRVFDATMVLSGLTIIGGLATSLYGSALPVFSEPQAVVDSAFMAWCTNDALVNDASGARYLALFTARYTMIDLGLGLILSAFTTAAVALALRAHCSAGEPWLRTPRYRATYLLLGAAALLWFFGSIIYSFRTDFDRMLLPWCADSIVIPLIATAITAAFACPTALICGWIVTRFFGCLPAPLDQWDSSRPFRSWAVSGIAVFAIVVTGLMLVDSFASSTSVGAPSFLVGIYLLASARAAILKPRAREVAALHGA